MKGFIKKIRHAVLILFTVNCALSVALSSCAAEKTVTRSDFLLDTFVTVTLYGSDDDALLDEALELCRRYDAMFDRHDPHSELARLNAAGGAPTTVSPELYALLEKALYYCKLSGGIYDISVAPVLDLWDFSAGGAPPDAAAVDAALARVNWERVLLSAGNTVELRGGVQIDLGSIAKGFIADEMAALLRGRTPGALIDLGGNTVAVGGKHNGAPFLIGVRKPFDTEGGIVGNLPVKDMSVVSSGVYERYFRAGGVLYHHILNARTGTPANTGLWGVTVVSPSSADADALSTVCFLLGPDDGLALIESLPDTEAVFLPDDGTVLPTSGLEAQWRGN